MSSTARWSLTQEALERLLERLGPDPETAGHEYQSLRTRLIDYFEVKGTHWPEVAADETLDRVARRLEDGEAIARVHAYARGVARFVLLEHWRRQMREQRALAGAAGDLTASPSGGEEARIACLARFLQCLSAKDRALIVGYYQGPGRSRLEGRKALAARLGIGCNALRARAHRVRARLGAHLRQQLASGG